MKRSEMLAVIQTALDSAAEPFLKVPARYADAVLEAILEAGMIPPGRIRTPQDSDWESKFNPVPFHSNSWEPEDDV